MKILSYLSILTPIWFWFEYSSKFKKIFFQIGPFGLNNRLLRSLLKEIMPFGKAIGHGLGYVLVRMLILAAIPLLYIFSQNPHLNLAKKLIPLVIYSDILDNLYSLSLSSGFYTLGVFYFMLFIFAVFANIFSGAHKLIPINLDTHNDSFAKAVLKAALFPTYHLVRSLKSAFGTSSNHFGIGHDKAELVPGKLDPIDRASIVLSRYICVSYYIQDVRNAIREYLSFLNKKGLGIGSGVQAVHKMIPQNHQTGNQNANLESPNLIEQNVSHDDAFIVSEMIEEVGFFSVLSTLHRMESERNGRNEYRYGTTNLSITIAPNSQDTQTIESWVHNIGVCKGTRMAKSMGIEIQQSMLNRNICNGNMIIVKKIGSTDFLNIKARYVTHEQIVKNCNAGLAVDQSSLYDFNHITRRLQSRKFGCLPTKERLYRIFKKSNVKSQD